MTLPLHCRLVSSGDLLGFFFLGHLWDWSLGQELGGSNGSSLGFGSLHIHRSNISTELKDPTEDIWCIIDMYLCNCYVLYFALLVL